MRQKKIEGWVAREYDGNLMFFSVYPERLLDHDLNVWWVPAGAVISFSIGYDETFKNVTWESGPVKASVYLEVYNDGEV